MDQWPAINRNEEQQFQVSHTNNNSNKTEQLESTKFAGNLSGLEFGLSKNSLSEKLGEKVTNDEAFNKETISDDRFPLLAGQAEVSRPYTPPNQTDTCKPLF